MRKIVLVLLGCIVLFSACQKIIEIELPEQELVPVVNCLFTEGEPFKVHLSRVKAADSKTYAAIDDASVKLFDGDEFLGTLNSEGEGVYLDSAFLPKIGHSYSLEIKSPDDDAIRVEDFLPGISLQVLGHHFIQNAGIDDEGQSYSELRIELSDSEDSENFYGISVLADPGVGKLFPLEITSNDTKITNEIIVEDYPDILVFRDDQFNASTTVVSVRFSYDIATHFRLYSFSSDAFSYIRSLIIHNYTKEYDFWEVYEPIAVYSNVENAYGIFAGYSFRDYKITAKNPLP
ncbi:DUF4249 domain-containing protein [Sunxiuqinia elliptica]|uniref:Uncharacterized protein DUF4249 n=1 Tax=Sunxiuqinia elliptica TaxID=655355 RepID=A0A4R6H765_9BACT|nr:DUF4249 domain-containing protein [Sunxiuqinia elliptica]TDO03366.1 uncharacterized protein DUF4249 [Sunxiuqinia elliptica]TDO59563.1 uncharacterized protein DUF4249 [Sunxiuqinia elliptica]